MMTDIERIEVVKIFADNALNYGRDRSPWKTPLFADGIEIATCEHLVWRNPNGKEITVSNFACQQNLMRALWTLSALTGESKWIEAAQNTAIWMLDHAIDANGLLYWGSHRMLDLQTMTVKGPFGKPPVHELKNVFPFYELMSEVRPAATARFGKAFWNAHIINWNEVSLNRHGYYNRKMGDVWDHPLVDRPSFREADGLSFINVGSDLIWAAGFIGKTTRDRHAISWAKHLARQFVEARDPTTKLGSYQFTRSRKRALPFQRLNTSSKGGDRAQRQMGPELGENVCEGKMLTAHEASAIYGKNALMQFELAQLLGAEGLDIMNWSLHGLKAFATQAYDEQTNQCRPMLTWGFNLENFELARDGYYGNKGTRFFKYSANDFLLSFVRAFAYSQDGLCWRMVTAIAKGMGLGDLGEEPGKQVKINQFTMVADAGAIFALVDLNRITGCHDYLELAQKISDNIIEARFFRGWFVSSLRARYASLDSVDALALITLSAAISGRWQVIRPYIGGRGCIHGSYRFQDGTVVSDMYDSDLYEGTHI